MTAISKLVAETERKSAFMTLAGFRCGLDSSAIVDRLHAKSDFHHSRRYKYCKESPF
jgi:hypothetical protein